MTDVMIAIDIDSEQEWSDYLVEKHLPGQHDQERHGSNLGQSILTTRAYALVEEAFKDKKYRDEPYINHLVRVATQFTDPDLQVIGLLHDAVEDTSITIAEIEKQFEYKIAAAVDALTRRPGEGYFEDYLPRLIQNHEAWHVKVADNQENYSHSLGDPSKASLLKRYERAKKYLLENGPVVKHLPGQHDQTTHGRKKNDDATAKIEDRGVIDYDQFRESLKSIPRLFRETKMKGLPPEGITDRYGKEYPQGVEFTGEEQQTLLGIFEDYRYLPQKAGECYTNAWHLYQAMSSNGLDVKYVEGHGDSIGFFPMGHAWVDWNGKQVDLTWSDDILNPRRPRDPKSTLSRILRNALVNAYKGYAVPEAYMEDFHRRTETYGPVTEDYENHMEIVRTGVLPWLKE